MGRGELAKEGVHAVPVDVVLAASAAERPIPAMDHLGAEARQTRAVHRAAIVVAVAPDHASKMIVLRRERFMPVHLAPVMDWLDRSCEATRKGSPVPYCWGIRAARVNSKSRGLGASKIDDQPGARASSKFLSTTRLGSKMVRVKLLTQS